MQKIFSIITCLLICLNSVTAQEDFRNQPPDPGPAPRIELGQAEQITLKNGLKIIVVENRKLPVVSFRIFVDAPPILEKDKAGYVEMTGQLLRTGTTSRNKSEIDETVDFLGAELASNANGVSGSCLSKYGEQLLEIMADIILHPSFPGDEFEKLKKQKLSDLARTRDDASLIAQNVSSVLRNGKNHPYGEVETEESVQNITIESCRNYYNTYFKPNISYLIITGDIDSWEAMQLGSKYFANWENKPVLRPDFPRPKKPETTQVNFVAKPGAVQSLINITYPVELKPGTSEAIKAVVLNTLLGGYPGSRLNMSLREDKGFTYGAGSKLQNDPVIGEFAAYASVRNEVTDSSLTVFLSEINRLRSETVSEEELDRVKNVITGSFARSLEDPETVANFTLNMARFGLSANFYKTWLETLNEITPDDVLGTAKKYLTPDQAHILVVGNREEVADKLLPFSGEGKINYYDPFGKLLREISLPAPEGVTADNILNDYLEAIGGLDKINQISSVIIAMNTDLQGVKLESVLYHKKPGRLSVSNKMMGNIIQQSIYDGDKGIVINMGEVKPMEEKKLMDMQVDGKLFPERFYKQLGVRTELMGIELVNDREAYKIKITYPSGTEKIQYFDLESSLKVKEIETEGDKTIVNQIGNYHEVNGVKFPHTIQVTGATPFPMTLETIAVEVNAEIDEGLFKVE